MKVGLILYKWEVTNTIGSGMLRYIYEIYNRIASESGTSVKLIEPIGNRIAARFVGNGLSWVFGNPFVDLSKFNIVHDLNFYRMPITARKGSVVIVSTAHDFIYITHPDIVLRDGNSLKERIWLKAIIGITLKTSFMSDYIIADSTLTRDDAVSLGYHRKRTFVVNLGVDKRFLCRTTDKVPGNTYKVGYIGSLGYKKNVGMAIDAFNQIEGHGIKLYIHGKHKYQYEVLRDAAGRNKNIAFMGFVPEEKLVETYDGFDAFVFPTLHEGFGLPILEAQTRGLPVIIYKKAQIAAEVRKYCLEAEDEAHMAQILQDLRDNGYNEKRRKEATEYAKGFTWERTAEETIDIYNKICK